LPVEITEAIGRDPLDAFAICQYQRQRRAVHVAHELLDESIELGEHALVLARARMAFLDQKPAAVAAAPTSAASRTSRRVSCMIILLEGLCVFEIPVDDRILAPVLEVEVPHSVSYTVKPSRSIALRRICRCSRSAGSPPA
jgi:hypothetical protein